MSNLLRFQVVEEAFKKKAVEVPTPSKAVEVPTPSERPSEYFGKYVFNRQKMYKYLPADVYAKLIDVMDNGARLDRSIADAVALGMKQWALEMGVTHYTHWFQPLTEGTAEKHDAFIEHDGKGGMIEMSATPSRLAATLLGIQLRPSLLSTTRSVSPPFSLLIRVRRSTIRHRCYVLSTP